MSVLEQWWSMIAPFVDWHVAEPVPSIHAFRTAGTRFPILANRPEIKDWSSKDDPETDTRPVKIGVASAAGRPGQNEDTAITFLGQAEIDGQIVPVGFAVIAAGMTGRWGGEYASAVAAETIAGRVIDQIIPDDVPESLAQPVVSADAICLADAMQTAHEMVSLYLPGSGAAVTTLLIVGDQTQIAHVGDSRAYLMAGGRLQLQTRDHSLLNLLREQGRLTAAQARAHAGHAFLYRFAGMRGEFVVDDIKEYLDPASLILLCSGGLWEALTDAQIEDTIITWGDPQKACEKLVETAIENGSPTSATAVIVQL
jgi:protein phosphatase